MFRYLILVWDSDDEARSRKAGQLVAELRATSRDWHTSMEGPGVCVLCAEASSGSMRVRKLSDDLVVLGALFRRTQDGSLDVSELSRSCIRQLVASKGRELMTEYWGNYVAVIRDPGRSVVRVLRGPASSVDCLRLNHEGLEIFFSFVEDCARLRLFTPSIDWEYVAAGLVSWLPGHQTGLKAISQVQPGECVEIGKGGPHLHRYWDAAAVTRSNTIEDVHEAARALRRVTTECVHAWAAHHPRILHALSGGLDSSIVLMCLKDAPTQPYVTCLTEYSAGPDTDEREYARLAARHVGCAHIEHERSSFVDLHRILEVSRSATPSPVTFRRVEVARQYAQLAHECDATAIFSGSCGDAVFLQSFAGLTVADFVHSQGMRPALGAVVYGAAQLEGMSVWRMLAQALRLAHAPRRHDPFADLKLNARMLTRDAVMAFECQKAKYLSWVRESISDLPPGKLQQVLALTAPDLFYDPMGRTGDPELVAPLWSQPLLELVLRIPTYMLMTGGWDRGLTRLAFSDSLPPEIARRTDKGGVTTHVQAVIQRNMRFIRDLLIDGALVQRGLLDRFKVEEALSGRPSHTNPPGTVEILGALTVEAWIRTWSALSPCAAV